MTEEKDDQHGYDDAQIVKKGLELSRRLKASLPLIIDPATISIRARIPFKALCIREVMLYRVSELAEAALSCYQKDQLVVATTLTRALLESVSLLYWLHKELRRAIAVGSSKKINKFLGKALVGTRNAPLHCLHIMCWMPSTLWQRMSKASENCTRNYVRSLTRTMEAD